MYRDKHCVYGVYRKYTTNKYCGIIRVRGNMDKAKRTKIIDIVLNVVTAIIVVIVLAVGISSIVNANVGYNSIFGVAGISVQSDSMKGDKKDNFKEGDLIYIDIIKTDQEKQEKIKEGDIITFWDTIEGKRALNTHRVVGIGDSGDTIYYTTHGDNNPEGVQEYIAISEVVGKFNGTILKGMGNVTDFFNGPVGFGIFVIGPSILLVIYAGFCVFKAFKSYNKEKLDTIIESIADESKELSDEEIERLYRERIAARENSSVSIDEGASADTEAVNDDTASVNSDVDEPKDNVQDVTDSESDNK